MKKILTRLNKDSIEVLSKESGMSRSNLSKTFKPRYEVTISKYKLQHRLIKAFELILDRKLSFF